MGIEFDDVFDVLAEAMPECPPEPSDWEDRLSYIYINEIVRYVCRWTHPDYEPLLKRFAALVERLFIEGDENVLGIGYEALESVWEHHDERDLIAGYFGPVTRDNWLQLCGGAHPQ